MSKKKQTEIQLVDPKAIVATMEEKMPEWVKELHSKEDMGNAIYATGTELLVAMRVCDPPLRRSPAVAISNCRSGNASQRPAPKEGRQRS